MLLSFLVIFAFGGAAAVPVPIDTCPGEWLAPDEYPRIVADALDGSPERARQLAQYYENAGELDEALYWGGIAVENGDEQWRHNYAYLLMSKGGAVNIRRALFHARIAESNDSFSAGLRKELEAKSPTEGELIDEVGEPDWGPGYPSGTRQSSDKGCASRG